MFTRFKEDVNLLREAFEKDGLEVKLLVGSTHEHDEFQAGSGDVLIANIAAGAEGIDLSRARYVIYYSVDHSRTMYEQSRWRVRRHEGGLPITYYHLEMEGSIDEDIYKALQGKGKMKDKIADAIERRIR